MELDMCVARKGVVMILFRSDADSNNRPVAWKVPRDGVPGMWYYKKKSRGQGEKGLEDI